MKRFSTILVIFLTLSFAQNAFAQKSFKIGFIQGEYGIGCGDQIWLATNKKQSQNEEVIFNTCLQQGLININGSDVELKSFKDYLPDKNFKVGRGGYQIWKGKNITVRLDYIITRLCPSNQESCSVYYYKGILEVNYNEKRRIVNIAGFGGS